MAHNSPKRLTAMARTIRAGNEKGNGMSSSLPGVSYLPVKLEIAEDRNVQERVSTEFIDFLDCVTDLLRLLNMIKARHLRSLIPIPFDIIRDIRSYKHKSTAMKRFEKQMNGKTKGISASVEELLTCKSMHGVNKQIKKPNLKKTNLKETNRQHADLIEIVGKKTKPIWHTVVMEKPRVLVTSIKDEVQQRSKKDMDAHRIVKEETSTKCGVFKTHSEELLCNVQYLRSFNLETSSESYENQMDMIEAHFDGFTSVEEHKRFLTTLTPHWFTDLIKLALTTGIVFCKPVTEAFHKLGEFYTFNDKSDPLVRGKLCFVLQSLPMWDVTRITCQRAAEFILRDILIVPNPSKDVSDWMASRRLPYVVLPPIKSCHNDFGNQTTKDDAKEKGKADGKEKGQEGGKKKGSKK